MQTLTTKPVPALIDYGKFCLPAGLAVFAARETITLPALYFFILTFSFSLGVRRLEFLMQK